MHKFLGLIGLLVLLFSSACSHYYYAPPQGHLLHVEQPKDLKVMGGMGIGKQGTMGLNGQIAYSPLKHVALSASYFTLGVEEEQGGRLFEGAIGSYFEIDRSVTAKGSDRYILVDLYGGYGKGKASYIDTPGTANINFNKFYLQGGIHFKKRNQAISFAYRGGVLDYRNVIFNGPIDNDLVAGVQLIDSKDHYFLNECFVKVEGGTEKVNFYGALSFASMPKSSFRYLRNTMHAGIVIDIHAIMEGGKAKKAKLKGQE